jgi:hypothetical protein
MRPEPQISHNTNLLAPVARLKLCVSFFFWKNQGNDVDLFADAPNIITERTFDEEDMQTHYDEYVH